MPAARDGVVIESAGPIVMLRAWVAVWAAGVVVSRTLTTKAKVPALSRCAGDTSGGTEAESGWERPGCNGPGVRSGAARGGERLRVGCGGKTSR